ncbi:HD-GYP domain-containing protein [Orenia marismortui]|uniref:HD-GYP domain-containing protein n=1 Tax=Orenia marismortui TaxID=46469 RepID=UPI000368693A|nr:HD domain-containing phosphohydrolase [Orenia marismortui]
MLVSQNLEEGLKKRFCRDVSNFDFFLYLLNKIQSSDQALYQHSLNVYNYSLLIGVNLELSRKRLKELAYAALFHDIGKLDIPKQILNEASKLSTKEYQIIKEHPIKASKFLNESNNLKKVETIILQHHERYDGSGYPYGVSKEDILLDARILAIADSFDAMTTDRCYKKGLGVVEAILELESYAGSQFDPGLVNLFIGILKEYYDL